MSRYTILSPVNHPGHVKPEIITFFEKFYEVSDNPRAHKQYSELFDKDAAFIMGRSERHGRRGK